MSDLLIIITSTSLVIFLVFLFKKDFISLSILTGIMYLVFYLLPAIDRIYDFQIFEFSLFNYKYDIHRYKYLLIISNIHVLFFLIGLSFFSLTFKPLKEVKSQSISLCVIFVFIQIYWVFNIFELSNQFGTNLWKLFVPSRKTGLLTGGYQKLLLIYLPWIGAILFWGKNKKLFYLMNFQTVLTVLMSGQRRFIINFILFYALSALVNINNRRAVLSRAIKYAVGLVLLVPGLWYARSWFTQLNRGSIESIPWENRSFTYLLFGSSSSGFETLLFFDLWADKLDIALFASFNYVIASFVPRSLWGDKPSSIPHIIKTTMGWEGNPSVFLSNELILNFGEWNFVFSLLCGLLLGLSFQMLNQHNRIVGIMSTTYCITLFKNGLGYMLPELGLFVILYYLLWTVTKLRYY